MSPTWRKIDGSEWRLDIDKRIRGYVVKRRGGWDWHVYRDGITSGVCQSRAEAMRAVEAEVERCNSG